ncbi:hypothetical protein MCEMAEM6B_00293 [Mycobacteriaceae bacterium]
MTKPRLQQVCKITYPNVKIHVGMDLAGTVLYFGSPSEGAQIAADRLNFALTIRKEILW